MGQTLWVSLIAEGPYVLYRGAISYVHDYFELSDPCMDSLPYICVKLVAAAAYGSGHDAQVVGIAEVFEEQEEEEEDVPLVS